MFGRYRFDHLVLCLTEPLFGHPSLSAVMTSLLPVTYLDWSRGRCPARTGDLPLDPSLSAEGAVQRIAPWLRINIDARPAARAVEARADDLETLS